MADLEREAVWKLKDEFSDEHLQNALEVLYGDKKQRIKLGERARNTILNNHAPRACATQYFDAIESFYQDAEMDINSLTRAISKVEPLPTDLGDLIPLAEALAKSITTRFSSRQLLVDISGLVSSSDQHEARSILQEWLNNPPEGLRIEPVYATAEQGYRYARHFTLDFLDCPIDGLIDEPVEYSSGDIFLGLACELEVVVKNSDFYQSIRAHGVHVEFVIYDGNLSTDLIKQQQDLFNIVVECDGVICKTEQTERTINEWLNKYPPERFRSFSTYFQESSATESGLDSGKVLNYLNQAIKWQ
jgi:hypothetical protein